MIMLLGGEVMERCDVLREQRSKKLRVGVDEK